MDKIESNEYDLEAQYVEQIIKHDNELARNESERAEFAKEYRQWEEAERDIKAYILQMQQLEQEHKRCRYRHFWQIALSSAISSGLMALILM
jgi:hypothetical protein